MPESVTEKPVTVSAEAVTAVLKHAVDSSSIRSHLEASAETLANDPRPGSCDAEVAAIMLRVASDDAARDAYVAAVKADGEAYQKRFAEAGKAPQTVTAGTPLRRRVLAAPKALRAFTGGEGF